MSEYIITLSNGVKVEAPSKTEAVYMAKAFQSPKKVKQGIIADELSRVAQSDRETFFEEMVNNNE
jgi:hypothetical protein